MRLPFFIFTLLLAASAAPLPAHAQDGQRASLGAPVILGNRQVRCENVRTLLDRRLPNLGAAEPDRRLLILNPRLLEGMSETVKLFVFHHECGHHQVGASELEADCWAVRRGLRERWLDGQGLKQVCGSFGNSPETATHPSAQRRCAHLEHCFATESAGLARDATRNPVRVASQEPQLLARPRLLWTGRSRS